MIQKVSLYFVLPMCIIAFFLSIFGVQQVALGDSYYSFLSSVGESFENWKFQIPNIPEIEARNIVDQSTKGSILGVLVSVLKVLIIIVNFIIKFLNFVIALINVIVQLIQFIFTLIYQCKDFINRQASCRFAYV